MKRIICVCVIFLAIFNSFLLYSMKSPTKLPVISEADEDEAPEAFKKKLQAYRQFQRRTNQDPFIDAIFPKDIDLIRPHEYIDLLYMFFTQKVGGSNRKNTIQCMKKRSETLNEDERDLLDFFHTIDLDIPQTKRISAFTMLYEYILPPSTAVIPYATKSRAATWLLNKNPLLKNNIFSVITIQHLVFKLFPYNIIQGLRLLAAAGAQVRKPCERLPSKKRLIPVKQKEIIDEFVGKNSIKILNLLKSKYHELLKIDKDEITKIMEIVDNSLEREEA